MISRVLLLLCCALTAAGAAADSNQFTVAATDNTADFFQIESSGRKNMAADDQRVALVWEETRGGHTASHLAFRPLAGDQPFGTPIVLGENDAFNPVIARCGSHFYTAWIEQDSIRATAFTGGQELPVVTVVSGSINELSIGCQTDSALLAWSARKGNGYAVSATVVQTEKDRLTTQTPVAVAASDTYRFQTNPGAAYAKGRVVITWHDRSSGTNLLYATSGKSLQQLDTQTQINELIKKSYEWGSGSSAVRNTLAVGEHQRLVAVWLDKRASRAGYKVYSAFSNDGGISWGDNYDIIDEWGAVVPQWTPAVASDGHDRVMAVWMDAREDMNCIWSAKLSGMTWGANTNLSDDAEEVHSPVIAYSPNGALHVAWIEIQQGKGSRIRYFSKAK